MQSQEELSDGSEEGGSSETMHFGEFLEAIAACAVYMDPSPYLSLPHKVLEFLKGTVLPGMRAAKGRKRRPPPPAKSTSSKEAAKRKK